MSASVLAVGTLCRPISEAYANISHREMTGPHIRKTEVVRIVEVLTEASASTGGYESEVN